VLGIEDLEWACDTWSEMLIATDSGKPADPLTKRIEKMCHDAHSCRMRALVALMRDDSGNAARTIDQLFDFDDDRMKATLSYLTLRVDTAQRKSETTTLVKYGWPVPVPGDPR